MKIVTAGQRGSGATGDEIGGARDNKRRLFSYSLVLLFSALATQARAVDPVQLATTNYVKGGLATKQDKITATPGDAGKALVVDSMGELAFGDVVVDTTEIEGDIADLQTNKADATDLAGKQAATDAAMTGKVLLGGSTPGTFTAVDIVDVYE